MIRSGILAIVAAAALVSVFVHDNGQSARAGALPSNIPGDATCSGGVNAVDALYNVLYEQRLQVGLACQTNGNVICGDEINLTDAMAIINYAAGLTPNLPPNCPPIGVDAAHGTVSGGSTTIHGTHLFDIDAGVEDPPSGTDFHWSIQENDPLDASLAPYPGAKIALINTFLSFEDVSYSQVVLAEFSGEPIRNTSLFDNTIVAVKTTDGNYAKMKLVDVIYDMPIQWVTYSPAP